MGARRALSDFATLLSEEGLSLYASRWLVHGDQLRLSSRQHPSSVWPGIEGLKDAVRAFINVTRPCPVLFANRSRSIAQSAIHALSLRCRRPMMVDLLWPPYQQLAITYCRRHGTKPSIARIRRRVFEDQFGADEVVELLSDHYWRNHCDGILMPSVSHDGVRLPVASIRQRIDGVHAPRLVIVDGAQGFAHMDGPEEVAAADIYLASAHKWLRSGLPLGIAVLTNPLTEDLLERCHRGNAVSADPLLRLSRELSSGRAATFGETVNVAPLVTCFGALQDKKCRITVKDSIQQQNRARLIECVNVLDWALLATSPDVQSGVFLIRHREHKLRRLPPSLVREWFDAHGIALTCYAGGYVRLSAPRENPLNDESLAQLQAALTEKKRRLRPSRKPPAGRFRGRKETRLDTGTSAQ